MPSAAGKISAYRIGGWGEPDVAEAVTFYARTYVRDRTRRREFTGGTPRSVRSTLALFADALDDPPGDTLTRNHILAWLSSMDVAASTARNRLSMVKAFCDWLIDREVLTVNPCNGIRGPRQPRAVPRALISDDVSRLLDAAPDARAELIILLMVQQGLRACEVANLELGDIDPIAGTMVVVGKGGNQRMLPITDETAAALRRYMAEHPANAGPVVRSYQRVHKALSAGYISERMSKWMAEAGVKHRPRDGVSGHALRHTAATDVLRATNGNVRVVQVMLGHQSLATTQRYLRTYPEELRDAMAGRAYHRRSASVSYLSERRDDAIASAP